MSNPPAFPRAATVIPEDEDATIINKSQEGMSLRDYFAAAALTGLIACPDTTGGYKTLSVDAYDYADAMLAAREQTRE